MTARPTVGIALLLVALAGCKAQLLKHDRRVAAQKATVFLSAAVIQQDYSAAYQMVREEDRRTLSQARFTELVKANHPKGFPTVVQATEYEPVLGQAAIQIFLVGKSDKDTMSRNRCRAMSCSGRGTVTLPLVAELSVPRTR